MFLLSLLVVIAFTASGPNIADNNILYFDNYVANIGGDFHKANGSFICRIPGLYFFSYSFISGHESSQSCRVNIMKGSTFLVQGNGVVSPTYGTHSTCSAQTVVLLQAGDEVYLKNVNGHSLWNAHHAVNIESSYSGFLVRRTQTSCSKK